MASIVIADVIRSMVVCSEQGYVVYWGCRLLYNICYRSEAGADVLMSRSTLLKVIEVSEYNHAGDPDVLRQVIHPFVAFTHLFTPLTLEYRFSTDREAEDGGGAGGLARLRGGRHREGDVVPVARLNTNYLCLCM